MRTLIGPPRPAISMSRASSRKTGAGKIPLPSRLTRRETSGGSVCTAGWVAMRASSCALNARTSSMSCCSTPAVADWTVDIGPSVLPAVRSVSEGGPKGPAERCSDALERALDRHRRDWHRVCVVPFVRETVDDVDHAIELSGHASEYL